MINLIYFLALYYYFYITCMYWFHVSCTANRKNVLVTCYYSTIPVVICTTDMLLVLPAAVSMFKKYIIPADISSVYLTAYLSYYGKYPDIL